VEIYKGKGRYFTFTGDVVNSKPPQQCTGPLLEIIEMLETRRAAHTAPAEIAEMVAAEVSAESAIAVEAAIFNAGGGWDMPDAAIQHARNAIKKIVPDHAENDGSKRLLAWARQCVKAGLTANDAIRIIREMEKTCPFPKNWTDADIQQRFEDAGDYCGSLKPTEAVPASPVPKDAATIPAPNISKLFQPFDMTQIFNHAPRRSRT